MEDRLFDEVADELRTEAGSASAGPDGTGKERASGRGDYSTLDVVAWFQAHQHYGRDLGDGKHAVRCPWEQEHSSGRGAADTDTVVWQASGAKWPSFHCSHAHCASRDLAAVMALWGDADKFCAREFRHTAAQPGDWEQPISFRQIQLPPFPTSALPPWLRTFVECVARATQTPSDLAGMLVLSALALALAKKFKVRVKPGWTVPLNLYTVAALRPGERKSPVFADVIRPVEAFEAAEVERRTPEIAEAASNYKIAERRLEKLQSDAVKAEPDALPGLKKEAARLAQELAQMQVPKEPRLLADDTTPERLAMLLAEQQGCMAVMSDEGGIFDLMAGRYSKNGSPNFEVFLKAHSGEAIRVDRVGRPPVYVPDPALKMGLAVQPEVIRALADKPGFRGRGLLARFLYAMPPSLLGHRDPNPPPVPREVGETYERWMRELLGLPFCTDEHGAATAHVLELSPGAWEPFLAFERWLEPQLAEFGELGQMTDWAGKLAGEIARIAGLLHVAESRGQEAPITKAIQAATMERALQFGPYLIAHARAAYAEMGADPVVEDARHLLAWIDRHEVSSFSKREAFEGVKGRFKRVEEMNPALELLISHGYIRELPTEARSGPGRRGSPRYEVNPLHSQNSHNSQNSAVGENSANTANSARRSDAPTSPAEDESEGPPWSDMRSDPMQAGRLHLEHPAPEAAVPAPEAEWEAATAVDDLRNPHEPERASAGQPQQEPTADPEAGIEGPQGQTAADTTSPTSPHGSFLCDLRPAVGELIPVSLVSTISELNDALQEIATAPIMGLDTETTGLDARADPVRLIQVAIPHRVFVFDCFQIDPRPLIPLLAARTVVAHNALFELAMLGHQFGFVPGPVSDTMIMAKLLSAGLPEASRTGYHGLEAVAGRELDVTLDKSFQQYDWAGPIGADALGYAAMDAALLLPLHTTLAAQIQEAGLTEVAAIEHRCLPAIAWMAAAGVPFDATAWNRLAEIAQAEATALEQEMNSLVHGQVRNWGSPAAVLKCFRQLGFDLPDTADETLAQIDHPLATLLLRHRRARKLVTSFGPNWVKNEAAGRIYPEWHQLGSKAGRMSCSKPNVQQIPRSSRYRACIAAPPGRVLVKADFSQIELRIVARIANEERMLEAYRAGEDLHALTTRRVLGKQEITKEDRQLAKALNFGLIYGMGPERLREHARTNYGIALTPEEATRFRAAFFETYPALRRWHRRQKDAPVTTQTLTGRRRLQVERYTEKLNSPVQGTGADGLKLALGLLWERREECPDAVPVIACHDEIVVEGAAEQADALARWLRQAMVDAMAPLIAPVPVEVDVQIGQTWAG